MHQLQLAGHACEGPTTISRERSAATLGWKEAILLRVRVSALSITCTFHDHTQAHARE